MSSTNLKPTPRMVFGKMDLDFDDEKTAPDIQYEPTGGELSIKDICEPLFISATWKIVAKIGDNVISTSDASNKPHSKEFVNLWARKFIRNHKHELLKHRIDDKAEYVKFGGNIKDLEY